MKYKPLILGIVIASVVFFSWLTIGHKKIEDVNIPISQFKDLALITDLKKYENEKIEDMELNLETFTNNLETKKGIYSFYIKDLESGKEFTNNSELIFNGASLYKVPVAVGILHNIQIGKKSFDTQLVYTSQDIEEGTGSIQSKPIGTSFTVEELLLLALKESDNAAINILQRNLTEAEVSEAFNIYKSSNKFYLDNLVTSYQMGKYLETVITGKYLNLENKKFFIKTLTNTSFDNRIDSGLNEKYIFAHKIGSAPEAGSWHDCGYIIFNGKIIYVVCLMSANTSFEEYLEVAKDFGELF